jgi:hypothetical protein
VWREGLLCKLIRCGLRGRMLRWIRDFLSDRRACVHYASYVSESLQYKYGIPQGSVLSPVSVSLLQIFLMNCSSVFHVMGAFSLMIL